MAEATAADNADAAEDDAYAAHYDDEEETRATATDAFTAAGEALAAVYNAEAAYYSAVADYAQTTADADAAAATTALGLPPTPLRSQLRLTPFLFKPQAALQRQRRRPSTLATPLAH